MAKSQGQSTVEYLLVTMLASVFVLVLAVQLSPSLKDRLQQLEDILVAKIQGGKLLTHAKVEALPPTGEISEVAAREGSEFSEGAGAQEPTGVEESVTGGGVESVVAGGVVNGSRASDFLKPSGEGESKTETTSEVLGEEGGSSGSSLGGGVVGSAASSTKERGLKKEKGSEKAKEKVEKDSATKGMRYGEGEEEDVFEQGGFQWMKILIVILIIILVAYILFEIYKTTKLGRSK